MVAVLMIMRRRFVPSYLFSFVVGFAFGEMMDVHELCIGFTAGMRGGRRN